MKNLWWGYLHVEGTIQAKRFFNAEDLSEAATSPFVRYYHGPFHAQNRAEAMKILREHFEMAMVPGETVDRVKYPLHPDQERAQGGINAAF